MKNTKRKGFTIVELVIVIAVIAILAAVLIPTFASLVNKANKSKDTQLVKNLNTALASDAKEHKTMGEALAAAEEFGYDVAKINASATGNEILWDSANDVFCYLNGDKGEIEYIPDSLKGEKPADYKYWQICTSMPETQKYSIYWNTEDALPENTTLTVGFESGKYATGLDLTYENTTGTARETVIRTNGGTLTINAEKDTVYHYGNAASVDIQAINTASYHAYGMVGHIKITKGHIVVEDGAEVSFISKGDNSSDATITNNGTLGMAPDFDEIEGNEPENKDATSTGTLTANGGYVKLTADQTISDDLTLSNNTVIDLNGYTITFTNDKQLVIEAEVTILDTVGNGKIAGTVKHRDNEGYNFVEVNGGKLTLNSGTIEAETNDSATYPAMVSVKNGATLIVNGGTIYHKKGASNSDKWIGSAVMVTGNGTKCYINGGLVKTDSNWTLGGNGRNGFEGTYIEINGGKIVSGNDSAIYHPQVGTLNINGGYFEGYSAIYQKAGSMTITGGVFKATGEKVDYKYNGNGGDPTGDCIIVDSCKGYGNGATTANIILSSTKITSENAAAVAGYTYSNTEAVIVWNGENVKSIKVN